MVGPLIDVIVPGGEGWAEDVAALSMSAERQGVPAARFALRVVPGDSSASFDATAREGVAPFVLLARERAAWSSGILRHGFQAARLHPQAIVAFPLLDLGQVADTDAQAIVDEAGFPERPDGLWRHARWSVNCDQGWLGPMRAPGALLLPRKRFEMIGGFGGGDFADLYRRAIDAAAPLYHVLGEGLFRLLPRAEAERPLPKSRGIQYLGRVPSGALHLVQDGLTRRLLSEHATRPNGPVATMRSAHERRDETSEPLDRHIVLVVGMHRSGTSYVARQLARNGFSVPGTPLGASLTSNPDGHFEPLEILAWHNAVLDSHSASWLSLAPLELRDEDERVAGLHRLLLDMAEAENEAPERGWVVKDPRICRLLPLWNALGERLARRFPRLFVLRDPEAVAASLQRRNGLDLAIGRALWARYTLDMLDHVEDERDLLTIDHVDTDGFSTHVARRIGLDLDPEPIRASALSPSSDPVAEAYRAFVAGRDLTRFRADLAAHMAFTETHPELVRLLDTSLLARA